MHGAQGVVATVGTPQSLPQGITYYGGDVGIFSNQFSKPGSNHSNS
jgi:hypothetical protein